MQVSICPDARLSPPPGKPRPSSVTLGFRHRRRAMAMVGHRRRLDRMSDDDDNIREPSGPQSSDPVHARPNGTSGAGRDGRRRKPKVRKLRLFWILLGLGGLAIVSTIFGMMMAVASDLPQIENRAEYKRLGANSYLYDDHWRKIGIFAPPNSEVIDTFAARPDGAATRSSRSRTSGSGPTPASTSGASRAPSWPT